MKDFGPEILRYNTHKVSNMSHIFNLNVNTSSNLSNFYQKAHNELCDFFELNWIRNLPMMYVLQGRKAIDEWQGEQNTNMSGWTWGSHQFYVVDQKTYEIENTNHYSEENYYKLIKHEMAHCFYQIITNGVTDPAWLWEGVAIYASGQDEKRELPKKFVHFLDSVESHEKGVYSEAGFAIQILVQRFRKEKLLEFLKDLPTGEIDKVFKKHFGEEPTYNFFNNL